MGAGAVPILSVIATALAIAACRRAFPPPTDPEPDDFLSEDERRTYRRWEVAAIVPTFLLIPPLAYGWYLLLSGAVGWAQAPTPATRWLVRPIPILWGGPAILLGIISAAPLLHWLYRALLGGRYPRYTRACNERSGYDGWRAFRWLSTLVLLGTGIGFFLVSRTYTRFEDRRVEIGRPFALRAATYDYGRVTAIEHRATFVAPSGKVIHRPHHIFRFDDGTAWDARTSTLRDPVPGLDGEIADLISRRSGRPIVEIP